jgi:hypothetical protein
LLFLILIGILLGMILYYIGSQFAQKKPDAMKHAAKAGGVLALLLFLLRLGPMAVFNLVNLFVMLLPFINRYSFSEKKEYNGSNRKSAMSKEEARQLLGVGDNATPQEVNSAFHRLMKRNHPDVGGTNYLAEKLIQARDILLD